MSERARIECAQGTGRHLQPDNFLEAVGTRHIGTDAPGDSIPPCWRRESVENRNAALQRSISTGGTAVGSVTKSFSACR